MADNGRPAESVGTNELAGNAAAGLSVTGKATPEEKWNESDTFSVFSGSTNLRVNLNNTIGF